MDRATSRTDKTKHGGAKTRDLRVWKRREMIALNCVTLKYNIFIVVIDSVGYCDDSGEGGNGDLHCVRFVCVFGHVCPPARLYILYVRFVFHGVRTCGTKIVFRFSFLLLEQKNGREKVERKSNVW